MIPAPKATSIEPSSGSMVPSRKNTIPVIKAIWCFLAGCMQWSKVVDFSIAFAQAKPHFEMTIRFAINTTSFRTAVSAEAVILSARTEFIEVESKYKRRRNKREKSNIIKRLPIVRALTRNTPSQTLRRMLLTTDNLSTPLEVTPSKVNNQPSTISEIL